MKAQGKPGPIGQVSRWHGPVCPATEGLTPAFNAFVSRRIKEIAARVGAPGGSCEDDNVRVIFTPEPDGLMVDVLDNHPNLLGYHTPSETRSLAAFLPPMKSWYVTGTRFAYKPVVMGQEGIQIDPPPGGVADAPGSLSITWECTGTRIRCEKASDISYVLVVVDARRVEGFTIDAVADEVAMVALSRPGPRGGCSPLPSVMDALNPECSKDGPIEGLTSYDEAYLRGLYAYKGSEIMAFENSAIAKSMVKATGPAPAGRQAQPVRRSCDGLGRFTVC